MSLRVEISRVDGTTRSVGPDEFPLLLGGSDGDIELAGIDDEQAAAWLGQSDGDLFVQIGESDARVLCNSTPVEASLWLHADDVLTIGATRIGIERQGDAVRLIVASAVDEVTTAPPLLADELVKETSSGTAAPGANLHPVEHRPRPPVRATRRRRRVRPRTIGLWAGLALLTASAWVLFTMRSVELSVTPEPDRLSVKGPWPIVSLENRWVLRPGEYSILAGKVGYRELDAPLLVDGGTAGRVEFELEKLPGILIIDSGGVVGAEVVIDGELRGMTPLDPLELPAGEFDLRIRAARHEDFAMRIAIEGLGRTQTVTARLPGRWAEVAFRSDPPGATVTIDGKRVGTTPVEVELLEGRHRYRLTLDGRKDHAGTLAVAAGEPRTLPAIRLDWSDVALRLESLPSGASVTVDGVYSGVAPLDLKLPPRLTHRIEISKGGYDSQTHEVSLEPGRSDELSVTLAARLGEIAISTTPSDATLSINGRPAGTANQVLTLPAIPHRVEVTKPGYETYRASVTPRPGFPQEIEVNLKTPEQIERESTPEIVRTAQGHEMVLVRGGRFRMGASRREPGRRANEALRDVELSRPFYISTGEISNDEFREFNEDHLSGEAGGYNLENDRHPVVRVTWEDAALFCNWLSTRESLRPVYARVGGRVVAARPLANGYRLPTEAEWSYAARYSGNNDPRKYPWGSELPVAAGSGNYADASAEGLLSGTVQGYDDGHAATSPVDAFEPNPLGLFNIGGNVAEWVHDRYSIYPSGAGGLELDPVGPDEGELHVIRGSSWMDASIGELRLTYRDYGEGPRPDLGFRIARYAK